MKVFSIYIGKKTILLFLLIILFVFLLISLFIAYNQYISNVAMSEKAFDNNDIAYTDILKLPVLYNAPAWLFDANNLSSIIGYVDYVFVGRVESFVKTNYEYAYDKEGKIIDSNNPMPYSVFNIAIIKNVKNSLKDTVKVIKPGGLCKDGKSVVMVGDNKLPDIGGIYIFYAIAQKDGTLILTGENRHAKIFLDTNSNDIIVIRSYVENSVEYSNLLDAYNDEIIYIRNRYIANDE